MVSIKWAIYEIYIFGQMWRINGKLDHEWKLQWKILIVELFNFWNLAFDLHQELYMKVLVDLNAYIYIYIFHRFYSVLFLHFLMCIAYYYYRFLFFFFIWNLYGTSLQHAWIIIIKTEKKHIDSVYGMFGLWFWINMLI